MPQNTKTKTILIKKNNQRLTRTPNMKSSFKRNKNNNLSINDDVIDLNEYHLDPLDSHIPPIPALPLKTHTNTINTQSSSSAIHLAADTTSTTITTLSAAMNTVIEHDTISIINQTDHDSVKTYEFEYDSDQLIAP
eukprot:268386_1